MVRVLGVVITVCLLLAGLETYDRSAAVAATQSVSSSLLAPRSGENLVHNSAFNKGRKGWLRGRGTAFAVRRAGLARSNGARLTTTRRAQAMLRSALSDAKAINTGDLFTAGAAVRSARGKRHGWLVVRLMDGTHGWTVKSVPFTLRDRRWHRIGTSLVTPRGGTTMRVLVQLAAAPRGTRTYVDSVELRYKGSTTQSAPTPLPSPSPTLPSPTLPSPTLPTSSPTPTSTPTSTPTVTPSSTPTGTPTSTPSSTPTATPSPSGKTLLSTSFDSFPTGPMSVSDFRSAMGDSKVGSSSSLARTSIVSDPGHGNVMRQHFAAGTYGTGAGITAFVHGPFANGTYDEATIDYDIRFVGAFDWGWGGKLPGLGGVNSSVSPGTPTGGNGPTDNGWSGRMMWDTPSSYSGHMSPNEGLAYMYHPTQTDNYGDNVWWKKGFSADSWHHVRAHYKMNTVGQSNGVLQVWLDGVQVLDLTNYVFRTRSDVHISHLYWHMFYGGATSKWAPSKDTDIETDNLKITAN